MQVWGDPPACNLTAPACVDPDTELPMCCTGDCAVVAVQSPSARMISPSDPSQGFELFYIGEQPTPSDPNTCDNDPSGVPYPRTTHMQFLCDWSVDGYARFDAAVQNATDDCDYTLRFSTRAACVGSAPLSGGWAFDIAVLVTAGVYWLTFCFLNFRATGVWALPAAHQAFFARHNAVALEGALFALNGCRTPNREAVEALLGSDGNGSGAAPALTKSVASAYGSVASASTAGDAQPSRAFTDL